jgi:hypothetical protein
VCGRGLAEDSRGERAVFVHNNNNNASAGCCCCLESQTKGAETGRIGFCVVLQSVSECVRACVRACVQVLRELFFTSVVPCTYNTAPRVLSTNKQVHRLVRSRRSRNAPAPFLLAGSLVLVPQFQSGRAPGNQSQWLPPGRVVRSSPNP